MIQSNVEKVLAMLQIQIDADNNFWRGSEFKCIRTHSDFGKTQLILNIFKTIYKKLMAKREKTVYILLKEHPAIVKKINILLFIEKYDLL